MLRGPVRRVPGRRRGGVMCGHDRGGGVGFAVFGFQVVDDGGVSGNGDRGVAEGFLDVFEVGAGGCQ